MLDFKKQEMDENVSVGDIYSVTKLNLLRFYLSTESITSTLVKNKTEIVNNSPEQNETSLEVAEEIIDMQIETTNVSVEESLPNDNLKYDICDFLHFPEVDEFPFQERLPVVDISEEKK